MLYINHRLKNVIYTNNVKSKRMVDLLKAEVAVFALFPLVYSRHYKKITAAEPGGNFRIHCDIIFFIS